jgi:hypothetical protein
VNLELAPRSAVEDLSFRRSVGWFVALTVVSIFLAGCGGARSEQDSMDTASHSPGVQRIVQERIATFHEYASIVAKSGLMRLVHRAEGCDWPAKGLRERSPELAVCMHRLRMTSLRAKALRSSLLDAADPRSRNYVGDPPSTIQRLVVETEQDALALRGEGLDATQARCDLWDGGTCAGWRGFVESSLWVMKVSLLHWPPTSLRMCRCVRH